MANELGRKEEAISVFFDDEAKSMASKHDEKGLPATAQAHVDDILSSGAKTVIEVGSGPGSVMIKLLEGGIDHVTGVDLSSKMNKIANERLEEANIDPSKYSITKQSFLDLEEQQVGAISLHRVLCCHPDREGMLEKSISYNPKIVTLTVPRPWLLMRFVIKIFAIFAKRSSSFHPYGHSQEGIDNQMTENNYKVTSRKKGWIWVQTSYQLNN
ncbi:MAG: class I SAM-dependent methyltransferase [Candidatus Heimdallarchaeota archaeon]|nr:class I SAM-dependent methyltransferase [Candidatus Heimdallarchaeota archaeon]